MEQETENIQSNTENVELKTKDLDLQRECFNVLHSPAMYTSIKNNVEAKDLNKFVPSFVGSGLPCTTTTSSMNDPDDSVEELMKENYINQNFNGLRNGQLSHLHHLESRSRNKDLVKNLVCEDKDPIRSSGREETMRIPSGMTGIKRSLRNQIGSNPDDISTYLRDGKETIMSRNIQPIQGLRTASASSFSDFFGKSSLKGEDVVCRNREAFAGYGGSIEDNSDEILGSEIKIASDALLKSSTKNGENPFHRIDHTGPESFHHGISLREWLKPGSRKVNKAKSLDLFRQITQLVDFSHSRGVILLDLRPSCFILLPSNRIKYIGSSDAYHNFGAKRPKIEDGASSFSYQPWFPSSFGSRNQSVHKIDSFVASPQHIAAQQESTYVLSQLEENWYTSPQERNERCQTFSSNIYCLGVLLFELLCGSGSSDGHAAAMSNLRHRILPPNFLSEYPREAGFCIWLLHPESSSRPTTREILQSELMRGSQGIHSGDGLSVFSEDDDIESDLLLHFLSSLEVQQQKHATTIVEDIGCLDEDIKAIERMHPLNTSPILSKTSQKPLTAREWVSHLGDPTSSGVTCKSFPPSNMNGSRLMRNLIHIKNAYFSMRAKIKETETGVATRSDKSLLKNREKWSRIQNEHEEPIMDQSNGRVGAFFEGLCKFARYSKFEVCGTSRTADFLNSTSVICSLSFDRDGDYIASAGTSKKIKVFEFSSLVNGSGDIHYPVVEMTNKSNLSSVCWNNYIKNYLASTDYDGVVQIWDASTGQGFSQYKEHQKRAWSVDFSHSDPTKLASGSDDCSVKLWSINESCSIGSIRNPANVCCVQFSALSPHMLAIGSADYKIYCYDLRNTRNPWCTLGGHTKTVSYVKFLDSETIVSASTDNTIKLWDLDKTSSAGVSSNACDITFSGHSNEKNFVGLSVLDGYIVCGSETNEVYSYYKSLPMPIASHKFGSIDPISGQKIEDDKGKFVSSVCWRKKSNMVVAANSCGNMKVLQMV